MFATRAGAQSLSSLGVLECVLLQKPNTNNRLFSQNILNSTMFMFTPSPMMEATNQKNIASTVLSRMPFSLRNKSHSDIRQHLEQYKDLVNSIQKHWTPFINGEVVSKLWNKIATCQSGVTVTSLINTPVSQIVVEQNTAENSKTSLCWGCSEMLCATQSLR